MGNGIWMFSVASAIYLAFKFLFMVNYISRNMNYYCIFKYIHVFTHNTLLIFIYIIEN